MADEDDPWVVAVDRRLERKQNRESIDPPQDLPHPTTPPSPDLWTHVVENGHAPPLGDGREREVELRKVDQHEQIRRPFVELAPEHAVGAKQSAALFGHLDEPE